MINLNCLNACYSSVQNLLYSLFAISKKNKYIKIKIKRTVILSVVLCGCKVDLSH
jgi:hypothetical protein